MFQVNTLPSLELGAGFASTKLVLAGIVSAITTVVAYFKLAKKPVRQLARIDFISYNISCGNLDKLGNLEKARMYISRTHARPRTALLGNLALIGLADCDYMEDRFAAAASKYSRALDRAGTQRARVLYQLGMCSNRLGRLREAEKYFREVTAT